MILKWLVILTFVLAIPVIYGQEKRPETGKSKDETKASDKPETQPSSIVIIDSGNAQPQSGQGSNAANDEPKNYLKRLFSTENLPTIALVLVGFLTLRVVWVQTIETRKAADAALLNAKAIIASERPWLVTTIQRFGDVEERYIVRVTNQGRTPAELVEGHQSCNMQSMTFRSPPAGFESPIWLPMETFIVNGGGFDINPNSPLCPDVTLQINAPGWSEGPEPKAVFVYGILYYWDLLTDRDAPSAEPYITRWIFRYNPYTREFTRCAGGYAKNT